MTRLTIADTLAGLEAGTFTSELLVEAFLAQIEQYNDALNAFTFLNPFALAQAHTSDRLRAAGAAIGAIEGVRCSAFPKTTKENYRNPENKKTFLHWLACEGYELPHSAHHKSCA